MKSMTGYAYRERSSAEYSCSVELKSYNNRYLDIGIVLPGGLSALESEIRERCSQKIGRGKLECGIRYRTFDSAPELVVDEMLVRSLAEKFRRICDAAQIEVSPDLSHFLRFDEVLREERGVDIDEARQRIVPVLEEALSELDNTRSAEGKSTRRSIVEHMKTVSDLVKTITTESESLERAITDSIRKRFREVLGDDVAEDRILAETAVLLVKFSIDEEIVRLNGHLEVFAATVDEAGQIGKKLDFLCQELHREINTIGSKSPLYEINRRVVEAKDSIEKIREQLRNVE